jgi:diguanylate cyclase (GGDEF)-like protein
VSERLSASLQDLVSELRLEEVLDKVVAHARAAVAGKDFALLVVEDDRLVCRSSTGLPPTSIATLEAWAAGHAALRREDHVLVDDARAVRALEPLAAHATHALRSLCAAPLVFRGETIGVLVGLTGHDRAFLPSDVDRVRDYAVQAAIAVANARLFAAQQELATRDPLTGLRNHREFHEVLGRELERSRRYGAPVSVALLDLNGFKLVNDASGHAAGDRVLRATAAALERSCRESDLAFRLGGDEFALLLPETSAEEAEAVARRAADAAGEADARTSAAFGVACWPADATTKDALLAHADAGLYAMKGRDRAARERLAVPLVADGRTWGLVAVESADLGALTPEDMALVEDLAGELSRRRSE